MDVYVHQPAMHIAKIVYRNKAASIFPMAPPATTSSAENCSISTGEKRGSSCEAVAASCDAVSDMDQNLSESGIGVWSKRGGAGLKFSVRPDSA